MSASAALAFPGSRTLATWWRQLANYHPLTLWVGYFLFHHITAPFVVLRSRKLPALEHFVLKALSFDAPASPSLIADRLHLDAALVRQLLRRLLAEGLVAPAGEGEASLSAAGRGALADAEYPEPCRQHRQLVFLHADWTTPAPSYFVHLDHGERMAWLTAPPTPFDLEVLDRCLKQEAAWKAGRRFPREICNLAAPMAGGNVQGWEQVIVVTPQRWFGLVLRAQTKEGLWLLGFSASTKNWELDAAAPAFAFAEEGAGWMDPPLPGVAVEQAFADWCGQRQIAELERQQCRLHLDGSRLMIGAPPALQERMHKGRGEFWIMAGDGSVRPALKLTWPEQAP